MSSLFFFDSVLTAQQIATIQSLGPSSQLLEKQSVSPHVLPVLESVNKQVWLAFDPQAKLRDDTFFVRVFLPC